MKSSPETWGAVTVALHWLVAATVFCMFGFGLWMTGLTYYDEWYRTAPHIHKSVGTLLFLATLMLFGWRHYRGRPPHLNTHSRWEHRLAMLAHGIIYVLLFAIMISGYMISTADGRAIEVFNWFEVPALFPGFDNQEDIAGKIHLVLAITLISLTVLHAAGALKHHYIDKDSTLKRMLGL